MIGINEIASYIPEKRISNYDRKEKFEITDHFIEKKIGVKSVSIKDEKEETSDLCVKAYKNLEKKIRIEKDKIDVIIVVTQNPDFNIPHTSAIVHEKLDLSNNCACFDISLGCSGFVYGLSTIEAFMERNYLKNGLLFTCDPYSKVIDENDKNTSLLFGDAATVSYINTNPVYKSEKFTFGTSGKKHKELICNNKCLYMNGGEIYSFVVENIPNDIHKLLEINYLTQDEIDKFVFHQGSKFIVDSLARMLSLDTEKVVYDILDYGNTVSSSIPIILEKEIKNPDNKYILISGFGVGLSWAGGILKKVK